MVVSQHAFAHAKLYSGGMQGARHAGPSLRTTPPAPHPHHTPVALSTGAPPSPPQADTDDGSELCERLGIDVLPTVQFWRDGQKLWEHRGVANVQQDLGEGEAGSGELGGGAACARWALQGVALRSLAVGRATLYLHTL